MGYGKTLQQIIKDRKTNVKKIAEMANIPPSTLYSAIQRDTSVRYDQAVVLASLLQCDLQLICDVPRFHTAKTLYENPWDVPENAARLDDLLKARYITKRIVPLTSLYSLPELTGEIFDLLCTFYCLNDDGRDTIMTILAALTHTRLDPDRTAAYKKLLADLDAQHQKSLLQNASTDVESDNQ